MLGFFIILAIVIAEIRFKNWRAYLWPLGYLYLTGLTIIISQSRSFWVGALAALSIILIFIWIRLKRAFKTSVGLGLLLTLMILSQILAVQVLTNNFSGNLVSDRFKNLQTEAAGLSRLNQLKPLTENIFQQLIFGWGFGKELTYISNDPRIIKTHPGGVYTTYAFEWGYLDIMLKLGALGLISYLFLIYQITKLGLKKIDPVTAGLISGLVALLATNIFSPYLNHPLGIGYVILVSVILNKEKVAEMINK